MWLQWIIGRVADQLRREVPMSIMVKLADGRVFAPFSIEVKGNVIYICENEEKS